MKSKFTAEKFKEKKDKSKIDLSDFLSAEEAFDKIEKQLKYVFDNMNAKTSFGEDTSDKIVIFLGSKPLSPDDKLKIREVYQEAGFSFRYKEEIENLFSDRDEKKKYVIYLTTK